MEHSRSNRILFFVSLISNIHPTRSMSGGAEETDSAAHPWVISIEIDGQHVCGGVLLSVPNSQITETIVALTSFDCVCIAGDKPRLKSANMMIWAGKHFLNGSQQRRQRMRKGAQQRRRHARQSADGVHVQRTRVRNVFCHPSYSNTNDGPKPSPLNFAVLWFHPAIKFNQFVQGIIYMANGSKSSCCTGWWATWWGWGKTDNRACTPPAVPAPAPVPGPVPAPVPTTSTLRPRTTRDRSRIEPRRRTFLLWCTGCDNSNLERAPRNRLEIDCDVVDHVCRCREGDPHCKDLPVEYYQEMCDVTAYGPGIMDRWTTSCTQIGCKYPQVRMVMDDSCAEQAKNKAVTCATPADWRGTEVWHMRHNQLVYPSVHRYKSSQGAWLNGNFGDQTRRPTDLCQMTGTQATYDFIDTSVAKRRRLARSVAHPCGLARVIQKSMVGFSDTTNILFDETACMRRNYRFTTHQMLCTGPVYSRIRPGERAPDYASGCEGDGGSPLFCEHVLHGPCLIGIYSHDATRPCEKNQPNAFSAVSSAIKWIAQRIEIAYTAQYLPNMARWMDPKMLYANRDGMKGEPEVRSTLPSLPRDDRKRLQDQPLGKQKYGANKNKATQKHQGKVGKAGKGNSRQVQVVGKQKQRQTNSANNRRWWKPNAPRGGPSARVAISATLKAKKEKQQAKQNTGRRG